MSRRFEGIKQLSKIKGESLVQRALDSANGSKANYCYLVLGYEASEIVSNIRLGRAEVLFNKNFARGLSGSLKTALSNLPEDCSGVLFMVSDQPLLSKEDLDEMIDAFRKDSGKMVALSLAGEPRNPVVIPRGFFPEVFKLQGDVGAREIVKNHPKDVLLIEGAERSFLDIDTRRDLRKLQRVEA